MKIAKYTIHDTEKIHNASNTQEQLQLYYSRISIYVFPYCFKFYFYIYSNRFLVINSILNIYNIVNL